MLLIVFFVIIIIIVIADNDLKNVSIVSIINPISMQGCMIKLHSIIESAGDNLNYLNFKFLLFDGLTVKVWDELFCNCFCIKLSKAGTTYESRVWESKSILREVVIKGGHKFNTERLFARFYLPWIFKDAERMLYIDNDAIVTEDLSYFRNYSMILSNSQKAAVGLVYEKAIFNRFYMNTHFHPTHPLMMAAKKRHGDKFYYNGGVMLVDRQTWIDLNLTSRAEELFMENDRIIRESKDHRPLYDSAVGDQGVFYMMLENVAYLDARFNMRRHPVKSILLLQDNITGIIHFAGTDGGLESLCRWPTLYPLYVKSAMPLYLTIFASLEKTCSVNDKMRKLVKSVFRNTKNIPNMTFCGHFKELQEEHNKLGIQVSYDPGKAANKFLWPPSG